MAIDKVPIRVDKACVLTPLLHSHIEAEIEWPTFRRLHFQTYFLEWKC